MHRLIHNSVVSKKDSRYDDPLTELGALSVLAPSCIVQRGRAALVCNKRLIEGIPGRWETAPFSTPNFRKNSEYGSSARVARAIQLVLRIRKFIAYSSVTFQQRKYNFYISRQSLLFHLFIFMHYLVAIASSSTGVILALLLQYCISLIQWFKTESN